ncbi:MAG: hypothetical protein ACTSPB_04530 [Candidatus Thorarchaeota archaeon]
MLDNFVTISAYISTVFMWVDDSVLLDEIVTEDTINNEYLPVWLKIIITVILVTAHVAGKLGWQPLKRREKSEENKDRLEGLDNDRDDDS